MLTLSKSDALADVASVAAHLHDPDVRLIEVDVSRVAYDAGHLEGAILWDAYKDLLQPNYRVIDAPALEQLLSRSGISPDTTVVFYGYAAALGFWLLKLYGHQDVQFLNGSRKKWEAEGLPMTTTLPALTPSAYPLKAPDSSIRATRETVEGAIGDAASILVDVRSELEYSGERFWPSLPPTGDERAGHIPGAVLIPIEETWREDGTFKSPDELRALYASKGVTQDKRVITYCTVGGRASQAWFVLTHLLAYPNASVYDASWAEWGTHPGTPIER
jgi:thiosulfate/3-mercaptopyruvate sulfurtransferase